jgi:hypothetical protein
MKLEFSRQMSKIPQILNFMKIRSVGAELLHAEGQTDTTKLIVAVRHFVIAPNNAWNNEYYCLSVYEYLMFT